MMRSMYSAISGLRVHQTKMDVIGNNIANVNTIGFKASKTTFQEVLTQVIRGAGSPQGGLGGTNPQQIGLGVDIASMNVNHKQGGVQRTEYPLDVMINGNGFFVVTNDTNVQNRYYTRAGAFTTDELGYLVDPNGYKVLGYDEKNAIAPVRVNYSATTPGTATGNKHTDPGTDRQKDISPVQVKGNINFDDEEYSTTIDVFDSLGRVHTISVNFTDKIVGNTTGTNPQAISYRKVQFGEKTTDVVFAKFDAQGNYVGLVKNVTKDATTGVIAETDPNTVIQFSLSNIPGADDIKFTINDSTFKDEKGNPLLTQFSGKSDAKGVRLTGNAAGVLDKFSISDKGQVTAVFTNGETKVISTLMLAAFDNAAGLEKTGNNLFADTINSGTPKLGKAGSGSIGSLVPGAYEMSNVDLSQEFVDMITTQRGFQANSRIITTTDEMLQELVNLKR